MILDKKIGYLAGVSYVASTLISMFYVEQLIAKFPNKFEVLFLTCAISMIFFTIINIKLMVKILSSVIDSWRLYIILSILIGINWLCSIFGVIHSNAFIYALGYFVFSASLAHLNLYLTLKKKLSGILFISAWMLLLVTFLENTEFVVGFMIAILGGATGYFYRKATVAFSAKESLTPTQIISVRFYPLIFLLGFKFNITNLLAITPHQVYIIAIFAVIAFIIPTYLNQVSILKLGTNDSTIISALIFPSSWFIEQVIHHKIIIDINFIIAIFAMLIIVLPIIHDLIIIKWRPTINYEN